MAYSTGVGWFKGVRKPKFGWAGDITDLYQFVTVCVFLIKCIFIQYFPQRSVGELKITVYT